MRFLSMAVASAFMASCAQPVPREAHLPANTAAFFKDYAANDATGKNTLPVFLAACRGDHRALDRIFSDYGRFGSGDNEAWGDVPDMLLAAMGDRRFSGYLSQRDLPLRVAAVKWLGEPGSNLYLDPERKARFPLTAGIQEAVFKTHPETQP
jgi:hypothetical protein